MLRPVFQFIAPFAAGVLVCWAGVYLTGLLAVFVVEQRYFGLRIEVVQLPLDFLAWVPVGIVVGIAIGYFLPRKAVIIGVATSVVAVVTLIGSLYWSLEQQISLKLVWFLFSPSFYLFLAIPLGSYVGSRLHASLTLRSSGTR